MKHYEITLLVHPDHAPQLPALLGGCQAKTLQGGGQVHRVQDLGSQRLASPVKGLAKARAACLNIECDAATLEGLESSFQFNDAVMRHLTVKTRRAPDALT